MIDNGIPKDRTGKFLKPGQWAEAELNKDPPIFIFGKIVSVDRKKSFIQPDERRGQEVENSKIRITIDIRV